MNSARVLVFLAATLPARAAEPAYDQQLAIGAARPYVESYVRSHGPPVGPFDWSKPTVESVERSEGTRKGYVAVFFPELKGAGAGSVYFAVRGELNLQPIEWGTSKDMQEAIKQFKSNAAAGHLANVGRE